MVIALAALGLVLRRLSKKSQTQQAAPPARRPDGRPVPNENPARTAVQKPESVQQFDAVNVRRPTMLALTTVRDGAVAPEVFIQRAFKIDREHWMEIASEQAVRDRLAPLFSHVVQLAWVPGSAFERHIYSVSFSPALEAGMREGIFADGNAAGVVTHVTAIDETGEALGTPMKMSLEGSQLGLVAALWSAFNPKGMPHALRAQLEKENAEVARRLSELPQHVAYETVQGWTLRYASLSAVVAAVKADVQGEAESYLREIDEISRDMHAQAARIDAEIDRRSKAVFSLEDADDALVHAIAYMYVRDLTVRFLRICALLRVSVGDSFEEEVRCANAVAGDVKRFTDVRELIAAAQKAAHDKLEISNVRTAGSHEIAKASSIARHASELTRLHDDFLADLQKEANKVQEDIDQTMLREAKLHRYAVRVGDDGRVEKFFVLNA